jgi:hypothetical protein
MDDGRPDLGDAALALAARALQTPEIDRFVQRVAAQLRDAEHPAHTLEEV